MSVREESECKIDERNPSTIEPYTNSGRCSKSSHVHHSALVQLPTIQLMYSTAQTCSSESLRACRTQAGVLWVRVVHAEDRMVGYQQSPRQPSFVPAIAAAWQEVH